MTRLNYATCSAGRVCNPPFLPAGVVSCRPLFVVVAAASASETGTAAAVQA
jgi:hypothetical protein